MKYLRLFLVLTALNLACTGAVAQISQGGTPISFQHNLRSEVQTLTMPYFDLQQLLVEDSLDQLAGGVPYRFGKSHEVYFTLENSGIWEELGNGDRLWRLRILSDDAYSINLIYEAFYLPPGASLFIYNDAQTDILGAFTEINNNPDGTFSSFLTRGSATTLEYYEPASVAGHGVISISNVVHGYRQMFGSKERGYGDSGWCNINVNCPEGDDWQDQKRGAAMVMLGSGTRWCSGSMINNTAQDGTPYFLTANHCRGGESNWIIVFNYESPGCENQDGPLNQTIQFTTLRAANSHSDFALVELSSVPPADYGVYYNGWSRVNEPHDWSCGIHHPRGDIKKISFDHDPVTSSSWGSGPANTHWRVGNWEEGTTEPSSSGSPLFDPQKRITGQLHGGTASCTSITFDAYGKLAVSWDYGSAPSTRLKEWLDPLETGVEVLDGWDPNNIGPQNDASLAEVLYPANAVCHRDTIVPVVVLRNSGALNLETAEVNYRLNNGEVVVYEWEGLLEPGQTDTLNLVPFFVKAGNHMFHTFTSLPNGANDDNPFNDGRFHAFTNAGHEVGFGFQTNDNPAGLSWRLVNEAGNQVAGSENLEADSTYYYAICLAPGCYSLVIEGGESAVLPNGYHLTNNSLMQQIAQTDGYTGYDSIAFCLNFPAASFIAEQDTICSGTSVQFHNLSIGGETFEWSFEGGDPASSMDESPVVFYPQAGTYDVTLKIAQGDDEDTFTREDYLFVVVCTGLEKQSASLRAKISPNPGNGIYTLHLDNPAEQLTNIRVMNLAGHQVFYRELETSAGLHQLRIDLSSLPAGIYLLQIESERELISKRIVQQ